MKPNKTAKKAIVNQWSNDGKCLVRNFFNKQKELPPAMRSGIAMISCPCKNCNRGRL